MNYTEIAVTIEPYNEVIVEILIAELSDIGCESFSDTDGGFNAYINQKTYNKQAIEQVFKTIDCEEKVEYIIADIETQNWNALWESNFEPVIIGDRCTIRAPFHENLPKTELEIIIEPKMAFGTGHHQTTYLISEALLDKDLTNQCVLDMGCGTGILAMIAALKGANRVDAIDNDEWATNNAIDNIEENGLSSKISVITGDAALLGKPQYNLILANINRNILLNDMAYYVKSMLPNASIIMSGIYIEDIEMIEKEAKSLGLSKVNEKSKDKWAMVEFVLHG